MKSGTQKISNLPKDRLERYQPFSNVGMDIFGLYVFHDGKGTRSTCATKKTWDLLFTWLYSRAVHIEPITSLDTPTFILALRRFFAVRGNCKTIRSNQATNLIGAMTQLSDIVNVDDLKRDLHKEGCT